MINEESWTKINEEKNQEILTTFKLHPESSGQIALRDEIKFNVSGSVSFE